MLLTNESPCFIFVLFLCSYYILIVFYKMMLIHNTYLTVIETKVFLSLKSFETFNDNICLFLQIYWDVIHSFNVSKVEELIEVLTF